jgi:replicative DNA helicase
VEAPSHRPPQDARRSSNGRGGGDSAGLPSAPDVEQSLIGACIVDDLALPELASLLDPEALFDARHRRAYQAMLSLFEDGEPVDLVTLTERLAERGDLKRAGGADYLTECSTSLASTSNIEHYARIVQEKWYLRSVAELGSRLQQRGSDNSEDAFDVLEFAESEVLDITAGGSMGRPVRLGEGIEGRAQRISEEEVEDGVTGVATGFPGLDRKTAGWQDGDLIIIAARPSMGKSSLAFGQALEAAHSDVGAGVFTLEMSVEQMRDRILSSEAKVDSQRVRRRFLTDDERGRLQDAAARLEALPIYIDYSPGQSVTQLRAKARQLKQAHDIGLVIVDYLQLMSGDPEAGNREQEIASISRGLKALAGELDVPVLALSQLNRSLESRSSKRPQLSDLRESGALEQDADVVTFIYRAEHYGITTDTNGNSTQGVAELIVDKQRNGPTGTVEVAFVKKFANFKPLARHNATTDDDPGF